jgi:hypothetical protein
MDSETADADSDGDAPRDSVPPCTGTPAPCSSPELQTYTGCGRQYGCAWSERDLTCHGTPFPCENIANEAMCRGAVGCAWS